MTAEATDRPCRTRCTGDGSRVARGVCSPTGHRSATAAVTGSSPQMGRLVVWPPSRSASAEQGAAPPAALVSRALEVAGRLANDAAEVITATAGRGAGAGRRDIAVRLGHRHRPDARAAHPPGADHGLSRHPGAGRGVRRPGRAGGCRGSRTGPEMLWVVDPVDGTSNYVAGLPWCGYSLALLESSRPAGRGGRRPVPGADLRRGARTRPAGQRASGGGRRAVGIDESTPWPAAWC